MFGRNSSATTSTVRSNDSGPALPAGRDKLGHKVPSEPEYTYTEYSKRETSCLRGDGTSTPIPGRRS